MKEKLLVTSLLTLAAGLTIGGVGNFNEGALIASESINAKNSNIEDTFFYCIENMASAKAVGFSGLTSVTKDITFSLASGKVVGTKSAGYSNALTEGAIEGLGQEDDENNNEDVNNIKASVTTVGTHTESYSNKILESLAKRGHDSSFVSNLYLENGALYVDGSCVLGIDLSNEGFPLSALNGEISKESPSIPLGKFAIKDVIVDSMLPLVSKDTNEKYGKIFEDWRKDALINTNVENINGESNWASGFSYSSSSNDGDTYKYEFSKDKTLWKSLGKSSGEGEPDDSVTTDSYLDLDTSNYYEKVDGQWTLIENIKDKMNEEGNLRWYLEKISDEDGDALEKLAFCLYKTFSRIDLDFSISFSEAGFKECSYTLNLGWTSTEETADSALMKAEVSYTKSSNITFDYYEQKEGETWESPVKTLEDKTGFIVFNSK